MCQDSRKLRGREVIDGNGLDPVDRDVGAGTTSSADGAATLDAQDVLARVLAPHAEGARRLDPGLFEQGADLVLAVFPDDDGSVSGGLEGADSGH